MSGHDRGQGIRGRRMFLHPPTGRPTRCWRRRAALAGLTAGLVVGPPSALIATAGEERHSIRLAQTGLDLSLAERVVAAPASRSPLPVSITTGEPPRHSYVRVRGLPSAISLSEGYAIAPGVWAVPLNGLMHLHMNVPTGIAGNSELTISLVSEDGALLAESKTILVIRAAPASARSAASMAPDAKTSASPDPKTQAPEGPVLTPQDRQRAEHFVSRAERDLENGNIALARQFLLRAAEAGLGRGALLLAGTYDPRELARLGAQGVQPDLAEARKWYERARELGMPEAAEKLAGLPSG